MTTLSRKQREIADREARILEVSRPMLVQEGYHGLSMEKVAAELEYSKGTIYNHFCCKEEIIIALAVQTTEKRTRMFARGAAFAGNGRERILAVSVAAELFVRLYPDHFLFEHVIRSGSIWEKTSESRRSVILGCEQRCMNIVSGILRDAVVSGELVMPEKMTPETLVFGLWSLTFGAYSIIATSDSLGDLGVSHPFVAVREHVMRLLDGYDWRPLSTVYDYEAVRHRIEDEVFADELNTASA